MTFVRPMLATLIDKPFDSNEWVYEVKWDGFRLLAVVAKRSVALYSRNGINVTSKYPKIAQSLQKITQQCILDGELVALDNKGRPRFQLLQNSESSRAPLRYYVFDLLSLGGKDTRTLTLLKRKALLKKIVPRSAHVRYSEHIQKNGIAFFAQMKRRKLEGMIAKRAEGKYYPGKRTREWLKVKTGQEQEVVIVGFTAPRASRKYFGSLLLAVRNKNKWQYVGRAGTGFDDATLATIHTKLLPLITRTKPIEAAVPDEKHTTWVRPKLIGEVTFTEWTKDGEMRHPAFKGLRTDKKPTEIVRERPK